MTSLPIRLSSALLVGSLLLVSCHSNGSSTGSSSGSSSGSTTTALADSMGGPKSARIAQEATVSASVLAVSPAARQATLRTEGGRVIDVTAGDAVRNFDQVRVGDTVKVRFQATLVATKLAADASMKGAEAAVVAARAPKGSTPGAGVAAGMSVRVRIESLDLPRDIVVFSLDSGELIAHRVGTDEGRQFVKDLKLGDVVQLDMGAGVALGIDRQAR